jgi:DNA polymerase
MADPITPDELAYHVAQHVESLRLAGVSFLPASASFALPVLSPSPTVAAAPADPVARSTDLLFSPPESSSVADGPSLEQRRQELDALRQRVAACQRCPHLAGTRTQTVFGVGPLDPELAFVGEAPGGDEDQQGEPFVGAAGQLLNRIITACGMKREEVYICNILRCRPPGNRTPNAEEAANCREFLERQLEIVRPKFICALGGCAAQNLLGTTTGIGMLRRRFHDYKGIPVLCTYHPAFLLPHRSPDKKKDVWEDMKMLLARMGRTVPGK